ncbi:MAG: sigma-E processing peptidase SpoIIGA [Candidatus Syntrophopropionicum ammoniitolerans]
MPEELLLCLEKDGKPDVWEFLGSLTGHHNVTRYSAVPFQSLGNINGLMIGFRPDAVFIDRAGQPVEIEKVVIAICKEQLDPAGGYKALLGAALLAELS